MKIQSIVGECFGGGVGDTSNKENSMIKAGGRGGGSEVKGPGKNMVVTLCIAKKDSTIHI